ncbi:hypothetical protein JKI95_11515 [Corynebacterium aquatimens]|uniref:hypothetical protein n=1 Tax=Corynebacterium TaxID=1716 RepID=UPI001F34AD6B|nr:MULTISPECIES: hypothetical protein [Corynebacterium]QYH19611.1 hypothetical protein JKI95_11515 [Corynebacterium aquatimens]UIZ91410.1 hypothetical protein JZY91_06465 [Corynebacterium sp. CNCTC7651]
MEETRAPVLLIPGSPALVAELSPAHAPSRRIAEAVRHAAELARNMYGASPVDIVCPCGERDYASRTGTFAAWGAPQVDVGGGNYLGELLTRYLLGERTYRPARETLAPLDPGALTVVVVDGPAGLTPRAPLAFIESAPGIHEALKHFIETGRDLPGAAALAQAGVDKHEPWEALAALNPVRAELVDADDTLGVGRYVGLWEVRC